jgi:hypothetical protein
MRQIINTGLLVAALVTTSGCRTNKIKEHIDDIDTVYVTTQRPTSPASPWGAAPSRTASRRA